MGNFSGGRDYNLDIIDTKRLHTRQRSLDETGDSNKAILACVHR